MASPLPPMPGETPQQRQARLAAADALQRQLDEERRAAMRGTMIAAPMAIPNYMPQGGLSVMDMGAAAMNSGPTAEQTARYLEALKQPGVIGGVWDADVGAYRMTARPFPQELPEPPRMPVMANMPYSGGSSGFDEGTGIYTPTADPMRAFLSANLPVTDTAPNTGPGMFGGVQPTGDTSPPLPIMMSPTINEVVRPTHRDPVPVAAQPLPDFYARPAPIMETPLPEPVMPAQPAMDVIPKLPPMLQPAPQFDPNQALNEYNAHLARIYQGGGQMDMDMIRAQQANLRDLQLNQQSTPEQHDAGYRAALGELRNRYPDAFAA